MTSTTQIPNSIHSGHGYEHDLPGLNTQDSASARGSGKNTPNGEEPIATAILNSVTNDKLHIPAIDSVDTIFTEQDSVRVRKKIDRWLLSVMFCIFTLTFMDKQALNYASIWGLRDDLHLTNQTYAWSGSMFYFGYLFAQLAFASLIHKLPIGKFCAAVTICWSIVLMCMPLCKNFAGLATNRFFLGFSEGFINPCFIMLTSMYYTRSEHALRSAVWSSGNSFGNIFGSILGYVFGSTNTSLAKWQLFPVVFGAISFCFAFVALYIIPDIPQKARFLNEEEKIVAIARVKANRAGVITSHHFVWSQAWEALSDLRVWLLWIIALAIAMQATGPGIFGSIIVKDFGFTTLQTTILQGVPTGLFQALMTISFGWIGSRYDGWRMYLMVISNIPAIIGGACLFALPKTKLLYIAYLSTYGAVATHPLYQATISTNIGGYTKRTVVTTGALILYATGQISGPHFFKKAPYSLGFGMMMSCFASIILAALTLRISYVRENNRRDLLVQIGKVIPELENDEFDLTDKQRQSSFRYKL